MRDTVRILDIRKLDAELAKYVPGHSLAALASRGLRGELMFAVPLVLTASPRLVGYYRLLYGFSQKEFFKPSIGGPLKAAETTGRLSDRAKAMLPLFCEAMAASGAILLAGVTSSEVTASVLDDLTLLTLGPQWRGSFNVRIGSAAIAAVFGVLKEMVRGALIEAGPNRLILKNAAGRGVSIEFAPDPDIIITEELPSGSRRHVVAIEIKGGRDFSNVHNRIGEAEKSHQKARAAGYTECWTVVNVDQIDLKMAKRESPSSDRFYRLSGLVAGEGADYVDFRDRVVSLTGIRLDTPPAS